MSSKKDLSPALYFLLGAVFALLMFFFGGATAWLAFQGSIALPFLQNTSPPPLLSPVYAEAWQVVEQDFDGPLPDITTRTYGAIRGTLQTLDDPNTYFIEPEPAVREQEQLQGRFGGIGAYLELNSEGQVVLHPLVGRPAAAAGLQDGDILLAIDGDMLPQPADLDAVTAHIRGPVGSQVRLLVRRGDEQLRFEITRQEIELPSVSWHYLEEQPDVLWIRIERFSELTDEEFAAAIEEATTTQMPSALILDLRNNPGGLLNTALKVSDDIIDDGLLLIERHADGSEKRYPATAGTVLPPTLPLRVLVDGGTASAAEIVAGVLQDYQRAKLAGQTTYGKGSMQRIHRLSDGSAVHVTFAHWYTPNGRPIDGTGLQPDIIVDNTPSEEPDPVLAAALHSLR